MYHPTPVRFSLPNDPIVLMNYKLRFANARYALIAEDIRARMKNRSAYSPYRVRAAWLGLRVDIKAAINCADNQISKIPLPILDTTPSPITSKITIRIPVSHVRSLSVPSITTTAPTPVGLTGANRSETIYAPIPTIRIPPRVPSAQNNWGVPGAPLLKTKELPGVSPQSYFSDCSPMSLDSDSSGPTTPEDQDIRPRHPGRRKIEDMNINDSLPHKHQMRRRWAGTPSTRRVTPRAVQQPHVYF